VTKCLHWKHAGAIRYQGSAISISCKMRPVISYHIPCGAKKNCTKLFF